jgi:small subunit ribosomal protein S1
MTEHRSEQQPQEGPRGESPQPPQQEPPAEQPQPAPPEAAPQQPEQQPKPPEQPGEQHEPAPTPAPDETDDPAERQAREKQQLDAELERELEAALGSASIDDLLAADEAQQQEQARARAAGGEEEGDVRTGRVIAVQGDDVFVDLGGKDQGVLPAGQFEDEPLPEPGATVEVTVEGVNEDEGLLVLSRKGAVLAAAWDRLERGLIVEGRVTGHNKGGLEMDLDGIRAFMPLSQIDTARIEDEDLGGYVNRRLPVEVIEFNPSEGDVVVSHRAVLDKQAEKAREQLWETLEPEQVVTGTVRSIMPYGAFVDIGGVDGLLHVSDMSYSRVEDPRKVVSEGQQIEVMVLKIDRENDRISLGLKQTRPDPWSTVAGQFQPGQIVDARVVRLMDFGAFVEVAEGVQGLVPISELSYERIKHPSKVLSEGDTVRLRVLNVEPERQRMSLSLKQLGEDPWTGASVRWPEGSVVEGRVTRTADFGAFVELGPGVEGLVHISELADGFTRSVADVVSEGQTVSVKVLSVDEEQRRMSLSIKQASAAAGGQAAAEPEPPPKPKPRKDLKGGLD